MSPRQFFICLLLAVVSQQAFAQDTTQKYHAWWNEYYPRRAKPNPKQKLLPLLHVQKNKFVNANGDTILFRGLSIADPDKLEHEGHWNKQLFVEIKKLGAMLVRIPVHPVAWRERGPVKYMQLLDSAASW